MNSFTFNGTSSNNWGLLVDNVRVFGAPAPDVESVSIAGRNGDLTLFNGRYNNYTVSYTISIINGFPMNARAIATWLLEPVGYQRLEDTYQPDYYRMGRFISSLEYTVTALCFYGKATVNFDCDPRLFLKSGETPIEITTSYENVLNPTAFDAKPLIRAYGTGTLTIGASEITITSADGYTDIDCETMNCYKGSTNCNNNVTVDEFPILTAGNTPVIFDGITKVEITPRWWEL